MPAGLSTASLARLSAEADLVGLTDLLVGLSDGERRDGASWAAAAVLPDPTDPALHEDWATGGFERWVDRRWLPALLVAGLEPPTRAGRHLPWGDLWAMTPVDRYPLLRRVLRARGESWLRTFVPATRAHGGHPPCYTLLQPLVVECGLPVPDHADFRDGWIRSFRDEKGEAADRRMEDDPLSSTLYPGVLTPDGVAAAGTNVIVAGGRLVELGWLDRPEIVGRALELLVTPLRAGPQRALAQLLGRLDVGPGDLPGGLPFAQHLVATAQGAVGAVLLPAALTLVSTPTELAELTTSIAGRPEKAQKSTLFAALDGTDLPQRVGVPAVLEALDLLASTSDDQRLHARVAAARRRYDPGPDGDPAADDPEHEHQPTLGLWDLTRPPRSVVVDRVGSWTRLTPEVTQGLAAELTRGETMPWVGRATPTDHYLAAVVEHAHHAPEAVLDWLRVSVPRAAREPGTLGEALVAWVEDPSVAGHRSAAARVGVARLGPTGHLVRPYSLATPATGLRHLLARESLLRLGAVPCLLSTPSHADHSLALGVLVERLRRLDGLAVGPLDLLQALLRLRQATQAERSQLDALSGVRVRVDDDVTPTAAPTGIDDVVALVRRWVDGGGLSRRMTSQVVGDEGQHFWVPDLDLPLPPSLLAQAPDDLLGDRQVVPEEMLRTVPGWPGLAITPRFALLGPQHMSYRRQLECLAGRDGPLDAACADTLLLEMVGTDPRDREGAAQLALTLIDEDRFDPALFGRVAVQRLDASVLPLARVSGVWDLIATSGGLRRIWPVMLTVADRACAVARRPTGTADLLRALSTLVVEVPSPDVPASVRALAAARGSTKAHHEARHLVALADGGRA